MRLHTPLPLLMLLASSNVFAQQTERHTANGYTVEIKTDEKDGRPFKYLIIDKAKPVDKTQSEEKRLIVKFKSDPLAKRTQNRQARSESIESEHSKFRADLQRLQSSIGARGSQPKILKEYKNVFNGFSIIASQEIEDKLKGLSYVQAVIEDKKVEVIDHASNQVIKADQVWNNLNVTGRGVVIGIIDTGIDYNHPDLGGSMGAESKVIGGYDFVNDDPDPMDDHGHGTHVAGIAAANGSTKGVAPDAKLVAFKVLNSGGSGYDSWILAAIEQSVDPDQNPLTDDALDVVNMSLGRYADAAEPYSEAIANATLQGVTFVVAAGNNGDYQTVGTPGVAPAAITVGATDNQDYAANFSSKGPTERNYSIKPDVCAPGVSIPSTFLNNGYQSMSGTSMASPHVAGAAALLLEQHPTWTPEIIKGALMQSAQTLSYDIWTQGAGRINVLNAIQQEIVVTPGSISLGLIDETGTKSATVTVRNLSSETKNISMSAEGDILGSGITYSISPSSYELLPGETKNVTVTFTVTGEIPLLDFRQGYFLKLLTSFDNKTIKSNVAFVKPKQLKIKLTGEYPSQIIVVGATPDNYVWKPLPITSSEFNIVLPEGTYNLYALYYPKHYVIKEGISNQGEIEFDKSQASNRILFEPIAENNSKMPEGYNGGNTITQGYNIITFHPYLEPEIFVSNTNTFKIDFHFTNTVYDFPNTLYSISASTNTGILESKTLSNNPLDFTTVNVNLPDAGPEEDFNLTFFSQTGIPRAFAMNMGIMSPYNIRNPLKVLLSQDEIFQDHSVFVKLQSMSSPEKVWESGGMKAMKTDQLGFYDRFIYPMDLLSNTKEFDYNLGEGLPRWIGKILTYDQGTYVLRDFPNTGFFNYHYGEIKRVPVYYEIRNNNQVIESGEMLNAHYLDENPQSNQLNVLPGSNQVMFKYLHNKVGNITGEAKVTLDFDLQNPEDKNPPHLQMLLLESNGKSVNSIQSNEPATLKFVVSDDYCFGCGGGETSGIENSSLYIKKSTSEEWINIPTKSPNTIYHSASLLGLEEGHYDLKLTTHDKEGNSLLYELLPAFVVTNDGPVQFDPVTLLTPPDLSTDEITQPQFSWTSTSGSLSYTIQLSRDADFSSIEIESTTTDTTFTPSTRLAFESNYYWRVQANYFGGSSDWSAAFNFTTGESSTISIVEPVNQTTDVSVSPTFRWTSDSQAISYTFQLSKSINFSIAEIEHTGQDTAFLAGQYLDFLTTYYCRVKANLQVVSDWSETITFTTEDRKPVSLISPVNNEENVISYPHFQWTTVPRAYWYLFQISEDSGFSSIAYEYTLWEPSVWIPYPLTYSTSYYWRVQVIYADQSTGQWSDAFKFTTQEEPVLSVVTLTEPANTETSVSLSPAFRWTATSNALIYILEISDQADFSNVVKQYGSIQPEFSISWPDYLSPATSYYWRVQAIYNEGGSEWSEAFHFITTPDDVALLQPANHAKANSSLVEFTWGKIKGIPEYHIEISENPNFDPTLDAIIIADTVYTNQVELPENTLIYWRVRSFYWHNGQWRFSDWSEHRDLSVIITGVQEEEKKGLKSLAYPNPFSRQTTISFTLKTPGEVQFHILDASGRSLKNFSGEYLEAGEKNITLTSSDLGITQDGLYYCKIQANGKTEVVKLAVHR